MHLLAELFMESLGFSKRGHISGVLHHQPTCVIDVPAGRNSERYYIPLYNVTFPYTKSLYRRFRDLHLGRSPPEA